MLRSSMPNARKRTAGPEPPPIAYTGDRVTLGSGELQRSAAI